ncbi:EI24 domain-containing protein [Paracoccus sp. Z330]|uniref:EI24 domain-containing protein n=1 Tax=Paracoccus onchidii TaxID=3017813 RepID=A0ABT4ZDM5_9RHOB|nr:EI24 domain-containing protein [Paracoccus onchidii]MDB6177464.1 EI24 domain-containing protein [Paracoccus onchidii]
MIAVRALLAGWADMLRPRILSLVLTGIALTIMLFVALQAATFWLIRFITSGSVTLPWLGQFDIGNVLSWGSLALFPILGFFLMAPVAAGFAGLFAERVAEAVEAIHYPTRRGRSLDFLDGLLESLAVVAAVIGVGIVTLILTPFIGPLSPVLFYTANGWLLGREFFQMAARRHLNEEQANTLRRHNGLRVTFAGALVAIGLTIPFVNIAVPLLAAAAFTHLFHMLSGTSGPAPRYRHG